MTKKKREFSYGDFLRYYIAQHKDSDYWEDAGKFCRDILAGCDVCWTCERFDVITYLEESRCICCHYPGKLDGYIDKPWKQKCKEFHPKEDG